MATTPWKLKRTRQCAKCPWKKSVNPHDIPDGYDVEKHKNLRGTIAQGDGLATLFQKDMHIMACHETEDAHCIGWLMNQIGPGNNIGLRLQMRHCENACKIQTEGEQHATFEETLPEE